MVHSLHTDPADTVPAYSPTTPATPYNAYYPDAENSRPNDNRTVVGNLQQQAVLLRMSSERNAAVAEGTEKAAAIAAKPLEERTPLEQKFYEEFLKYSPALNQNPRWVGTWKPTAVEVTHLMKKSLKAIETGTSEDFPRWGPKKLIDWRYGPEKTPEEKRQEIIKDHAKQRRQQQVAADLAEKYYNDRRGKYGSTSRQPLKAPVKPPVKRTAPRASSPTPPPTRAGSPVPKPSPVRPGERGPSALIKRTIATMESDVQAKRPRKEVEHDDARVLFGEDEPSGNE
jgi:hypothetical protein